MSQARQQGGNVTDDGFFGAVVTASPTPLLVLERRISAWEIVYVNQAFERRTGFAARQMLDCDWRVLCADPTDDISRRIQAALDGAHVLQAVLRTSFRRGCRSWSEAQIAPLTDPGQSARRVLLLRDVTAERSRQEALEHRALHDDLTGLPNRGLLEQRLSRALEDARARERTFALAMLDLDGFKPINDRLGHAAGDELLRIVGARLRNELRHFDTVARVGGDEFLLLLESAEDGTAVPDVIHRLQAVLRQPALLGSGLVSVGCSIGVAWYPVDGRDGEQLFRSADAAMYAAKRAKCVHPGHWRRESPVGPLA